MTVLPLVAAALLSRPQENRPVFRVSTEAVQVDVFVGEDRKAVPGLRASDFELYDEGALQNVDSVTVAEMPLNVVLALDTSASVRGETFAHLHRAAGAFLDELSPDDRAGLLTFSHHLSLRSGLTSNVTPLKESLHVNEAAGGTAWHDALFGALEILEPVRERPMVLLFTDGADTYSWLSEEQVEALVARSSAVVYAVARDDKGPMPHLGTTRADQEYRQQRRERIARTRLLHEVTRVSGGRLIETDSFDRLQEIFLAILAEMNTRYILSYTPAEPVRNGWHSLEVKVKRKGVDVHARRGYYYEAR
jgi:VWFA-related protein